MLNIYSALQHHLTICAKVNHLSNQTLCLPISQLMFTFCSFKKFTLLSLTFFLFLLAIYNKTQ
ncbi:hypothetical protein CW304_23300 [Bacillus sp. UFRGS-B20]|nr:hypothetical protein CW304_23300 [Bacillus sp. UFRGS-B20]